jgi:hypothetical protein
VGEQRVRDRFLALEGVPDILIRVLRSELESRGLEVAAPAPPCRAAIVAKPFALDQDPLDGMGPAFVA